MLLFEVHSTMSGSKARRLSFTTVSADKHIDQCYSQPPLSRKWKTFITTSK